MSLKNKSLEKMYKTLDKEFISLTCPHCATAIEYTWVCKIHSDSGMHYVYLCNNCQKLLKTSEIPGFSEQVPA